MSWRPRLGRALAAVTVLVGLAAIVPSTATAHPLGNFTSNRAIVITVNGAIEVTAVLDLAEIPAYETIRELDQDGDDAVAQAEGTRWADETCAAWRANLQTTVGGTDVELVPLGEPSLAFPAGAGGLPTLRLECRSMIELDGPGPHRLTIRDATVDERVGWREVVAMATGTAQVLESNVPATSETDLLTTYPEDRLDAAPDVRSADLLVRLGTGSEVGGGAPSAVDEPAGGMDPLGTLLSGELSVGIVVVAFALSIGLGAAHALSPGHGKTLVAAYVLGAGGSARSAMRIGLWVALSHTAGVFVLGIVTLAASEWLLPERLIGWLSLGSGIIVIGLGLVLLARVIGDRRRRGHQHAHGHPHGHAHPHPHPHPHDGDHGHRDDAPGDGELSWRSAIALGFAGGAVPSASALIVLLVAISTDRLLLGGMLIGAFGIGMAAVLGGMAFAIARVRRFALDRPGSGASPVVRRALAIAPAVAGIAVLATGVVFTATALERLA